MDSNLIFGATIDQLKVGDTFSVTEMIRERDILLYMGVTGDANPVYLQNEYSQNAGNAFAIVPPIVLMGIMTKIISMNFPGPGSQLVEMNVNFSQSLPHNATVTLNFEITRVEALKEFVTVHVTGHRAEDATQPVLDAMITVVPPNNQLSDQLSYADTDNLQIVPGDDELV
ncbi:hypothetical protein AWM75_06255 [Aerococcus urinaehominis]|uniref:Uncharacterized protein n=1 Tax=Aerococcus urinaehominis TaxID=128944 RepID=A0A0X8FMX3_9LACT|nr:MaoC/PaaZ C-terminal domain-containing protein [Aerococcus urinaehominis]AMB99607.1 hypothetical protein AWM75_06255 [Aerococcus urinaehominis]SDL87241.1 Acyl dehydratase [Aerococcus urinaehominis]